MSVPGESLATTEDFLAEQAAAIRAAMRRTAEGAIETGLRLRSVSDRIEHGRFLAWIDAELGVSYRTAYNLMNVASVFDGKFETVSNLPVKVLYALAAPSTPPEVREQFVAQAEAGEPMRYRDVRAAIDEAKAPLELGPPYERFVCPDCGEAFDVTPDMGGAVWHCPGCDHHWPTGIAPAWCKNCHNWEYDDATGTVFEVEAGDDSEHEQAFSVVRHPIVSDLPPARIPELRTPTRGEKILGELIRMALVVQDDPAEIAEDAVRWCGRSAPNYLSSEDAILAWHKAFFAELRKRLDAPLRAVK